MQCFPTYLLNYTKNVNSQAVPHFIIDPMFICIMCLATANIRQMCTTISRSTVCKWSFYISIVFCIPLQKLLDILWWYKTRNKPALNFFWSVSSERGLTCPWLNIKDIMMSKFIQQYLYQVWQNSSNTKRKKKVIFLIFWSNWMN